MKQLILDDHADAPRLPSGLETALGNASSELTPREREVLRWLATGKTDGEIAALLSLSPRTVQKHLEHIYVKLGVETRTSAVTRALGTWRLGEGPKPIIECSIKSSS
jgi:DNA-binding CsgD family transcriptional regulator